MQPYRLVLIGEKSSLGRVLTPLAAGYQADLYLPTGEISDTLMYQMARAAPRTAARWWCCTSPTATRPGGRWPSRSRASCRRSRRCCSARLGVRGVPGRAHPRIRSGEYGLPSTPLKETEKRADRGGRRWAWTRPRSTRSPRCGPTCCGRSPATPWRRSSTMTLDRRVTGARGRMARAAHGDRRGELDGEQLARRIRAEAAAKLDGMREQIAELNDALRIDVNDRPAADRDARSRNGKVASHPR